MDSGQWGDSGCHNIYQGTNSLYEFTFESTTPTTIFSVGKFIEIT